MSAEQTPDIADLAASDEAQKRCGRGICLAESGHDGSCVEASFGTPPRKHYLKGDDCSCGFAAGLGSKCRCVR